MLRGLLSVLGGIVLVIGGSFISSVGGAVGADGAGAAGGLIMILGVIGLLAGLVMWVGAIGAFMEKGWAPLLIAVAFGLTALVAIVNIATGGGMGIFVLVMLALDLAAAGWGAMNAPQIPIGNGQKQAQAV